MSGFMEMWGQMGFLAKAIVVVLAVMSIWSISVRLSSLRALSESSQPQPEAVRANTNRTANIDFLLATFMPIFASKDGSS